MKFITVSAFVLSAITAVSAFCCSGPQCADGTGGTPCCATQSCNIFCCACGGRTFSSPLALMPYTGAILARSFCDVFILTDTKQNPKL